jgi:hypothetical protein
MNRINFSASMGVAPKLTPGLMLSGSSVLPHLSEAGLAILAIDQAD